jgi:hypothetical protein
MSNLMKRLHFTVIPDGPVTREILKWMNYVVIPMLFLFAGLYRVFATASTPFEEYLGVTIAIGFALIWPIFVSILPRKADAP